LAHTGEVVIAGTLFLGGEAALGTSSNVRINGGTLQLTAPLTSSRKLIVRNGIGTVNTADFDATFNNSLVGIVLSPRPESAN
jgi:hypothetical protein